MLPPYILTYLPLLHAQVLDYHLPLINLIGIDACSAWYMMLQGIKIPENDNVCRVLIRSLIFREVHLSHVRDTFQPPSASCMFTGSSTSSQ